jgi:hypothetical protein
VVVVADVVDVVVVDVDVVVVVVIIFPYLFIHRNSSNMKSLTKISFNY